MLQYHTGNTGLLEVRVYVANNGNHDKLKVIKSDDRLGLMFTPFDYKKNWTHHHALDNGAFSAWTKGTCFQSGDFIHILKVIPNPEFAVIPDIVAGGKKSLKFSLDWVDFLPTTFKWYLAVQDGMTPQMIPQQLLEKITGIFVGGTMDWKMETSEAWIKFAHERKLKAHIGRIGTLERLMMCERLGADSVDSSNFAQHKSNWDELIQWLRGDHQPLEIFN